MGWFPTLPYPTFGGQPIPFPTTQPTSTGGGQQQGGWSSIFTNPQNLILLGSSILGSILNRPKGLTDEQKRTSDAQQRALQQLIATLSARAGQPATIDQNLRNSLYGQAAESAVGAQNRGLNALSRRGIANSGITANYLGKVSNELQRGQTGIDISLANAAQQRQAQDQAALLSALGIPMNAPQTGQSVGGAALEGFAPMLAYLLRLQQLQSKAGG